MSKYIDADRLKAEIEKNTPDRLQLLIYRDIILALIDSLQQEQGLIIINKKDWEAQEQFRKNKDFGKPLQQEQPSLPDNLDEAAREIVIKMHPCLQDCTILGDRLTRGQLMALVKAGAEWQYQKDRCEFAKLKAKEWMNGYDEGYANGLNAGKEE